MRRAVDSRRREPLIFSIAISGIIAAGCHSPTVWRFQRATLPDRHVESYDPLVVHSDFRIAEGHRLIEELRRLEPRVLTTLGLPPSDESVHMYLFETSEAYADFIREHYPDFPLRRALFLETDTRLVVLAHWGDRIAEDLRHEVTHGYIHSVTPNLPLWLDEGLAEYFEVSPTAGGTHADHVRLLSELRADGGWQPNLERLEAIDSFESLSQRDYAESWLWVYWLLHTRPERRELLRAYISSSEADRGSEHFSTWLQRAEQRPEERLLRMLDQIAQAHAGPQPVENHLRTPLGLAHQVEAK